MVTIEVKNITKIYSNTLLFKNVNHTFKAGKSYAINGHNGSGKSTFLQILSGFVSADAGEVKFWKDGKTLPVENWYRHINIATPLTELFDEMTLQEAVNFHYGFKKLLHFSNSAELITYVGLDKHVDKPLSNFSSGMLQKIKLALAVFSEGEVLFLDEPCSNFDAANKQWYKDTILNFTKNKLVIIASNDAFETTMCDEVISITDYKTETQ